MYTKEEIARDSQMALSKVDFEENIDDRVKSMLDKIAFAILFDCENNSIGRKKKVASMPDEI